MIEHLRVKFSDGEERGGLCPKNTGVSSLETPLAYFSQT